MNAFLFSLGGAWEGGWGEKKQWLDILKLFIQIKHDKTLVSFCRVKADTGQCISPEG